jgi:hypothetical protein
VYLDPASAIAARVALTEVHSDEVKVTNADRKKEGPRSTRRGQFGSADGSEESEWAERVRLEKVKKLALERSGGVSDVAAQAQTEVREEVDVVVL